MNEQKYSKETDLAIIKTHVIAMAKTQDSILKAMNGKEGMITQQGILKDSLTRLWALFISAVTVGSSSMLALCLYIASKLPK